MARRKQPRGEPGLNFQARCWAPDQRAAFARGRDRSGVAPTIVGAWAGGVVIIRACGNVMQAWRPV
jgi:hypothetical protein